MSKTSSFSAPAIDAHSLTKRYQSRTALHLAPVLLVVAWGVAWIASHASEHAGAHTLFQTLALAESVIALLLRRRKPAGALAGILVAYFVFELDPLLLPPLLIALFTVATLRDHRTVLLATAAAATTVAALPLTGRASVDLAGHLLPRLLAVATTAAIGLWAKSTYDKTHHDRSPQPHQPLASSLWRRSRPTADEAVKSPPTAHDGAGAHSYLGLASELTSSEHTHE